MQPTLPVALTPLTLVSPASSTSHSRTTAALSLVSSGLVLRKTGVHCTLETQFPKRLISLPDGHAYLHTAESPLSLMTIISGFRTMSIRLEIPMFSARVAYLACFELYSILIFGSAPLKIKAFLSLIIFLSRNSMTGMGTSTLQRTSFDSSCSTLISSMASQLKLLRNTWSKSLRRPIKITMASSL